MAETEQTAEQKPASAAAADAVSGSAEDTGAEVRAAEFEKAEGRETGGKEEHLDMLLDIQLPVTVSLGKADLPLRRLLQLQPGSVLSLEKRIGDPAELIVQDVPFATGDIVVVDDCYAVRIREILNSPAVVGEQVESRS